MGAPGAGKGTQAGALASRYGVPAISTGDIFRSNIKEQTPLGVKVKEIIDAGGYVPDETTEEIVADRLGQPDCADGFLLDGFPRTMHQVRFLDKYLAERGQSLDAVVALHVDPEALVERLLERATIEGRADDNEETIRRRMEVYAGQTAPLLSYYEDNGLLLEIDGTGSVEGVRERMFDQLDAKRP
jgi:adenylate kinase